MHPSIRVDLAEEKNEQPIGGITAATAAGAQQVNSMITALMAGQHEHPSLLTSGGGSSPPGGSSPTHSVSSSRRRRAALLGSNGGGMLGANLKMIDGELVPQPVSVAGRSGLRASHGSAAGSSSGYLSSAGYASSPRGSSNAYFSTHTSTSAAAASSSLPQVLHPSAHALTTLPSFSHEALGAYQLRIDPELHLELASLKHNKHLTLHRKTEICLQALESLANRCIINHGETGNQSDEPPSVADAETAAILQYLGVGGASVHPPAEPQLDGVPVSQHQAALKSTILNLRSMILPLLLAPRHVFQESLNKAEECAVKHGAIRYETEDLSSSSAKTQSQHSDSVRIGVDGQILREGVKGAAATAAEEEALQLQQQREEQRREKEAKLAHLEAQLRMHDELLTEEKRVEVDRTVGVLVSRSGEEEDLAGDESSAAVSKPSPAVPQSAKPSFNHRFLLTRDSDCTSLDSNQIPYYEVVQNLQYLKSALVTKFSSLSADYCEKLANSTVKINEIQQLKEINRTKDIRGLNHIRNEIRLMNEWNTLRNKLQENLAELKKTKQKNQEMKRELNKNNNNLGNDSSHGLIKNGKDGGSGGGNKDTSKRKPFSQFVSHHRDAKKSYEDLVMDLKSKTDLISSYMVSISLSNAEKDNLTTQVEILEQAVQTMRYMIKDILRKINLQEGIKGKVMQILTKGGQMIAAATAAGAMSPVHAAPVTQGAVMPPAHTRRSSLGSLPPVAGSGSSSSSVLLLTDPGSPRRLDKGFFRTEGTISTHLSSKNMIACHGYGSHVPRFLQYAGWVARYDLGKRHTELIIKEIWSLKTIADETRRKSGLKRTTLQDFFLKYLKSRFPSGSTPALQSLSQHRKMEFVYNFVEACGRYSSDHDMDLFQKILMGNCSEERYIDSMTMMAHFKKTLTQMDIIDGRRDGFIHKMVFFAGLRQFFPVKSEENMRALIEIVLKEMQTRTPLIAHNALSLGGGGGINSSSSSSSSSGSGSGSGSISSSGGGGGGVGYGGEMAVDISKLIAETSDGDESAFIDLIRNQYEEEVNSFPLEIANALVKASKELFGPTGIPPVQITWSGQSGHSASSGSGGSGSMAATQNHVRNQSITTTSSAVVRSVSPSPFAPSDSNGGSLFPSSSSSSGSGAQSIGWLPAGQIAAILQELDPNKTKHEIEMLMRRGLGLDGYFLANANANAQARAGGANSTEPHTLHAQLAREKNDSSLHGRNGSSSSRSNTPSQNHFRSPSNFSSSPHQQQQKESPGPGHLLRKTSFSSPNNSQGHGQVGLSINLPRRESIDGESGIIAPSTPIILSAPPPVASGSGGSSNSGNNLLNPALLTNSRAQGRMSVGNGLAFAALKEQAAQAVNTIAPSSLSPTSPAALAAVASASPTASNTNTVASPSPVAAAPSAASAGGASSKHSRDSSRRSSGSRVTGAMVLGADGRMRPGTGHGHSNSLSRSMSIMGGGGGLNGQAQYDPGQFVELGGFLERLNSLFLHRAGHYNADLDIPGLAKLIKDELERVADEERRARELAAAKKGLGTGLQVNAAALPSWAALWPSYKRVKDNVHIRDEILAALVKRYSKRNAASPTPSDDGAERSNSRLSQHSQRSTNSNFNRVKSRAPGMHGRSGSTLSNRSASPAPSSSPVPSSPFDPVAPPAESIYSINENLNSIVTFYRGDATKLQIDAVVNAANPQLVAGGGICAAIFSAAGHAQLSRACNKLGGCAYGHTKVTPGFKMPCRFILHSVSPVDNTDASTLESCYNTILDCCLARGIRSVAMCCLATGIYGFRNVDAAEIALRTTRVWLDNHKDPNSGAVPLERIVFCVFTEEDMVVYNTLLTIFFPCPPVSDKPTASPSADTAADSTAQWPTSSAAASSTQPRKPALAIDTGDKSSSSPAPKKTLTFAHEAAVLQRVVSVLDAPAPVSPTHKPTNPRRRSGKSIGSALGLGTGGTSANLAAISAAANAADGASQSGVTVAPPAGGLPAVSLFSPLRRKLMSGNGSSSARSLSSYKYELPASLLPPPIKTAAQLFSDTTVAAFVPPPVVPKEGTAEYRAYQAQKSGAALTSAAAAAALLMPLGPDGKPAPSASSASSTRVKRTHSTSLHGLARLVRNNKGAEEEEEV